MSCEEAAQWGYEPKGNLSQVIRPYLNGRDLVSNSRGVLVIDFFDLSQDSASKYSKPYQRVLERVKPERDIAHRDPKIQTYWWRLGRERKELRSALAGISRYIATVETAKHRLFVFLDRDVLPDNKLIAIALDNDYYLGVLSSRVHLCWALAAGGRLGVGNDPVYIKSKCFDAFPFPDPVSSVRKNIEDLGNRLETFRKERLAAHPELTLTGMYNLLEKLRSGEPFNAKEKALHEKSLTSILKEIHDELNSAVFDAYGWPHDISDEEILERLVALNHERADEEAHGLIRYLRPDFQAPAASTVPTKTVENLASKVRKRKGPAKPGVEASPNKAPWPAEIPEQFMAIRMLLRQESRPWTVEDVQVKFKSSRKETIRQRLEALEGLGAVVRLSSGDRETWSAQ